MYRTTGSLAFVAAARAAFLVSKDPLYPYRRLMLPIKNNLGDDSTGFAYQIAVAENGTPSVEWEDDPVMTTADEALIPPLTEGENTAVDEAQEWLKMVLKEGPVETLIIKKQSTKEGLSWGTIRRAKDRLKIGAKKVGKTWCWVLSARNQDAHQDAHLSNLKSEEEIQVAHPTPVPPDEHLEQVDQVIENK